MDLVSSSGVHANVVFINVEELRLGKKATTVPAPSRSLRLEDVLGSYLEHIHNDFSDVES